MTRKRENRNRMNAPKISVIVLVYNNGRYLKETISSILNQSYKEYEIIVGDDASLKDVELVKEVDASLQESKSIQAKFIYNQENVGTVKNFNAAIKQAQGDIIVPLSCGDFFYEEGTLGKIADYFTSSGALICTAKRKGYYDDSHEGKIFPSIRNMKKIRGNQQSLYRYMMLCGNIISGACTYYTKELFEKYGLFDERYRLLEDWPYYLHIMARGEKIHFMDEITIRYNMEGVSSGKKMHPQLKIDYDNSFLYRFEDNKFEGNVWEKRIKSYWILKMKEGNSMSLRMKYFDVVLYLRIAKWWRDL